MADMTVYPMPITTTSHDHQSNQSFASTATQPKPTAELAAEVEANGPLIPRQPDGGAPGPCHLLAKLPLELRNAIYALLLPPTPPQYPSSFRRYRMPASARPRFWTPAVAQACRQLRHEVLTLYLGGIVANEKHDDVLRVGLWVQEPWDAIYLERWLHDLGEDARLVRRLAINHEVDFFHPFLGSRTVWADTLFTDVSQDEEGGQDGVRVECDFGAPTNAVSDQIPAGTVCLCPITARMRPANRVKLPLTGVADCALTRAIYAFLALMDQEGQDAIAIPRFRSADEWASHAGGLCRRCDLRRWYLQGPKTLNYRRRMRVDDGVFASEIDVYGQQWTVWSEKWSHKVTGRGGCDTM
ncbi:hypothetical protein PG987_001461 [Apiospora arundinis]